MRISVVIILFLLSHSLSAQFIRGTVTNDKNEAIPFATVYLESILTGTTTNFDGYYEFQLNPGSYRIIFRALGYKQTSREIVVENSDIILNIKMETEVYQLKEVVVSSRSEDPAYGIMRKVIARSPYHLNLVQNYVADLYLKGTAIFEKVPKIISKRMVVQSNGKEYKIKTGDVFVEESLNELKYTAPGNYFQRVKSIRSTMPFGEGNPVTPIELIKTSFYQNEVFSDLNSCISPLAQNAFSHYKFVYEGFSTEGDLIIDKIKVIPRRKSQQLFSGTIYIAERYWALHSLDLTLQQFWGDVRIKQEYAMVKEEAWLPVSYSFHFNASYMGVSGKYKYSSSVKYSSIRLNEKLAGVNQGKPGGNIGQKNINLPDPSKVSSNKNMKKQKKELQKELAPRDTAHSLEIISPIKTTVDPGSTRTDTSYWSDIRPVPLSSEEIKSYEEFKQPVKNRNEKDSLQRPGRKKIGATGKTKWILSTQNWYPGDSSIRIQYKGLIIPKFLSFNTVDGWNYRQEMNFRYQIDSIHLLTLAPTLRYAFNRNALLGKLDGSYNYAPFRRGRLTFSLGYTSMDYNAETGISETINTFSSLFFRRNYLKLEELAFLSLQNRIDLANGLEWRLGIGYSDHQPLKNFSDFSFFYRNARTYTENIPDHSYLENNPPDAFRQLELSTSLSYTPEYFYKMENYRKMMQHSRYPTFGLHFRSGISGILGAKLPFQELSLSVEQRIRMPEQKHFYYQVQSGTFLMDHPRAFSSFRHFNAQPLPVELKGFRNAFQGLDYYSSSTDSWFAQAFARYETNLLLLKRIPIISERLWREALYVSYLSTPDLHHYWEAGYGLLGIAGFVDAGVFTSFNSMNFRQVVFRINLSFPD